MSIISEMTMAATYDGVAVAMLVNGASLKDVESHIGALLRIEEMISEELNRKEQGHETVIVGTSYGERSELGVSTTVWLWRQ